MKKTVVVNLFAGPCAGKTTCAWEIASELKKRGIEAEYVSEVAKDYVWDGRTDILDGTLEHQKMLYDKQAHRIDRLLGKVDVIVTDSPTVLSLMYLKEPDKAFENLAVNEFKQYNNFNLFINRGGRFQNTGRIHSEAESKALDDKIKGFLDGNHIYYGTYYHKTVGVLVDNIVKNLKNVQQKHGEGLPNKIRGADELAAANTKYSLFRIERAISYNSLEQLSPGCSIAIGSAYHKIGEYDNEADAVERLGDCQTEILLLDNKKCAVLLEYNLVKSEYNGDICAGSENLGFSRLCFNENYTLPTSSSARLAEHIYNELESELNAVYMRQKDEKSLWCGSLKAQLSNLRSISDYLVSQSPIINSYREYADRTSALEDAFKPEMTEAGFTQAM